MKFKKSKSAYQGKIFVKDKAQKTDAYQLSKALLLSDTSEFNAKPELEIYADDVKCSHGSTSGSINEDSIFYLMTRGLNYKQSKGLLINGFLLDVVEKITDKEIIKNKYNKIVISPGPGNPNQSGNCLKIVKSLYKITEGKGVLGNLLETIIHKDRYYNDRYTYAVLAFYIMYMLTVFFLWFFLIISWPLMVPLLILLILFFKKLKLT